MSDYVAPQVGLEPTTTRLTAGCSAIELLRKVESGSDLSSRAVSSQVLSALKGLTSVFGMGTGGTPSSLPPEMVSYVGSAHGLFRQSGLSPSSAAARLLVLSHYNGFLFACQPLLCVYRTLTTAQD